MVEDAAKKQERKREKESERESERWRGVRKGKTEKKRETEKRGRRGGECAIESGRIDRSNYLAKSEPMIRGSPKISASRSAQSPGAGRGDEGSRS